MGKTMGKITTRTRTVPPATAADPKAGRRKAKRSFTLSLQSVAFLESLRKKRPSESVSSVLEEILQAARREEARARADRGIADYYSSLSDAEEREQTEWGEFAVREFAKESR